MNSPRILCAVRAGFLAFVSLSSVTAEAVTVSIGAGSAVSSIDRSATFDTIISDNISLSGYTEDGLKISSPGVSDVGVYAYSLDGSATGPMDKYFYNANGTTQYATITASDGVDIFGLEFHLGHTYISIPGAGVVWETYRNNVLTGAGVFTATRGDVIGWSDAAGFDELRVGAADPAYTSFGQLSVLVIDDLNVQVSAVPLPAAAWLFGTGLLGLLGVARQRRHT